MRDFSAKVDLKEAYRTLRGQIEKAYIPEPVKRNVTSDYYQSFLKKYRSMDEESIASFNARDLMYFFREKSKEADCKYVIANMHRDMGIFKRLQSSYSNIEICTMVEFLFNSSQDYLERMGLQPTVLASAWCNTIYSDTVLWVEDKYFPKSKKVKPQREWKSENKDSVRIGEWD